MISRKEKNQGIIQFKVSEFIRKNNKDMKPMFDELEGQDFVGVGKAYDYVCENFGSVFFNHVEVFLNGKKVPKYEIGLNC